MGEVVDAVVGDVRLAYEVHGRSDAPPLILLHALGEGRRDWAPVLDRFEERFRVFAIDLRGHGDSDWPGRYSLQLMADDVLRLLDHLDVPAVTLIGHSMGGAVAYLLAEQHPDRAELLVIEDASPPFPRERPTPDRPDGELGFDWPLVPAIVAEFNRDNPVMWDRLPSITAPTLLIGGGPDSHIPQEKLQEAAQRIPDCSVVTIPAGHLVHATRPADFADTVLDWLARRRSGATSAC